MKLFKKRKVKSTSVTYTVPKMSYVREKDKVLLLVKLKLAEKLNPTFDIKQKGKDVVITATIEKIEEQDNEQ